MFRKTGLILLLSFFLVHPLFPLGKQSPLEWKKKGDELFSRGDYRGSIESYREALLANPRYREALLGIANCYRQLNEFSYAESYYTELLKYYKDDTGAMTGLGLVSLEEGNNANAMKLFREVESRDPGNLENNYAIGYYYEKNRHPEVAIRYYRKIVKSNPSHIKARIHLAKVYLVSGELNEADRLLSMAEKIDPLNPEIHNTMAALATEKGMRENSTEKKSRMLERAYDSYLKSTQLTPDSSTARVKIAMLNFYRNRNDAALLELTSLIENHTADAPVFILAAALLLQKGKGQKDALKAVDYLQTALKITPSDSLLRYTLENVLIKHSGLPGMVTRKREMSMFHRNLMRFYKESGRMDRYRYHLKRSIELLPGSSDLIEKRMELNRLDGNYEDFLNDLIVLNRMDPGNVQLSMRLNEALVNRHRSLPFREGLLQKGEWALENTYGKTPAKILVFDLKPEENIPYHAEGGSSIASAIIFHLGMMGRVAPVSVDTRNQVLKAMDEASHGDEFVKLGSYYDPSLANIIDEAESDGENVDYIIQGSYRGNGAHLSVRLNIIEKKTNRIIDRFYLKDTGKEALHTIAERAARKMESTLPFSGRVLKVRSGEIVVNLGTKEEIKPDDLLNIESREGHTGKAKVVEVSSRILIATPVDFIWYRASEGDIVTYSGESAASGKK